MSVSHVAADVIRFTVKVLRGSLIVVEDVCFTVNDGGADASVFEQSVGPLTQDPARKYPVILNFGQGGVISQATRLRR